MAFQLADSQPVEARRHYVDVLRGAAALAVFLSHSDNGHLVDPGFTADQRTFLGVLGVYVFFILSGYLIWNSSRYLGQEGGLRTYAIHRVTRLVPLYLVNVAFAMWALPLAAGALNATTDNPVFQPHSLEVLWRHLSFTQTLLPKVSAELNPVLWTLTHEALFYALVPLLVRVPVLLVAAIGALAYLAGARTFTPLAPFLLVFYLFTIGILFAERRFLAGLLAAAVFTLLRTTDSPALEVACVPLATLLVLGGLMLPARGLRLTRPLQLLGVISFSVYIWHYLLIAILGNHLGLAVLSRLTFGLTENGFFRALVASAIIVAACTISYWLIERPSMTRLRDFLLRRHAPAGAGARA